MRTTVASQTTWSVDKFVDALNHLDCHSAAIEDRLVSFLSNSSKNEHNLQSKRQWSFHDGLTAFRACLENLSKLWSTLPSQERPACRSFLRQSKTSSGRKYLPIASLIQCCRSLSAFLLSRAADPSQLHNSIRYELAFTNRLLEFELSDITLKELEKAYNALNFLLSYKNSENLVEWKNQWVTASLSAASINLEKSLFFLLSEGEHSDVSVSVVTLQINALRFLYSIQRQQLSKSTIESIVSPTGPVHWCTYLFTQNREAGIPRLEMLARLLAKFASASAYPSHAFLLYLCACHCWLPLASISEKYILSMASTLLKSLAHCNYKQVSYQTFRKFFLDLKDIPFTISTPQKVQILYQLTLLHFHYQAYSECLSYALEGFQSSTDNPSYRLRFSAYIYALKILGLEVPLSFPETFSSALSFCNSKDNNHSHAETLLDVLEHLHQLFKSSVNLSMLADFIGLCFQLLQGITLSAYEEAAQEKVVQKANRVLSLVFQLLREPIVAELFVPYYNYLCSFCRAIGCTEFLHRLSNLLYNFAITSEERGKKLSLIDSSLKISYLCPFVSSDFLVKAHKWTQLNLLDKDFPPNLETFQESFRLADHILSQVPPNDSSIDEIIVVICSSLPDLREEQFRSLFMPASSQLLSKFFIYIRDHDDDNINVLNVLIDTLLHKCKSLRSQLLITCSYGSLAFENAFPCTSLSQAFNIPSGCFDGVHSKASIFILSNVYNSWRKLLRSNRPAKADVLKELLALWDAPGTKLVEEATSLDLERDEMLEVTRYIFTVMNLLDINDEPYATISFLEQMLQIFKKSSQHSVSEYVVYISVLLADKYLELGYSGKAYSHFVSSKAYFRKSSITKQLVNLWRICYSKYLVRTGNFDKSFAMLKECSLSKLKDNFFSHLAISDRMKFLLIEGWELGLAFYYLGFTEYALCVILHALKLIKAFTSKVHNKETTISCWVLLPICIRLYEFCGQLYEHMGLVREAEFFHRQALGTARKTGIQVSALRSNLPLSLLLTKSGRTAEGEKLLVESEALLKLNQPYHKLLWLLTAAESHEANGCIDKTMDTYAMCLDLINTMLCIDCSKMAQLPSLIADLHSLSLSLGSSENDNKGGMGTAVLNDLKATITRKQSLHMASQYCIDDAKRLFKDSLRKNILNFYNTVSSKIARSKIMLYETEYTLKSDPVLRTLRDSVISLPGVSKQKQKQTKAFISLDSPRLRSNLTQKGESKMDILRDRLRVILESASRNCEEIFQEVYSKGSVQLCRNTNELLFYTTIMQNGLINLDPPKEPDAVIASYFLESSKALGISHRIFFRNLSRKIDLKSQIQFDDESIVMRRLPKVQDFKCDVIDTLPLNWSIVSIAISESKEDLFLSKVRKNQNPLVVRLPLQRHNSRDADEEIFLFQSAYDELQSIIDRSNQITREGKDYKTREEKERWWKERRELDCTLAALLNNIESCWLGGFKGIFSSKRPHKESFMRFSYQFKRVLGKNLTFLTKNSSIDLAPEILELFINLGPPDSEDFEQLLEDLIYFILDIFNFRGIHFAYDEIDLDQVTVDIQEALKSYHANCIEEESDNEHTVLVLDKIVHAFPWESLPSLRGKSVSRVPSFEVLNRLILADKTIDNSFVEVDPSKGSYILNPALDLRNTQQKFEQQLIQLGWPGYIGKPPTSDEFKNLLKHSDVFLYFGHGGGEQYITSQDIMSLDRCAVSILMGCSSGALHESGLYEPWGTPVSYLVGGCPTLVANLWDITDKDIDRFSQNMLERWGLFAKDRLRPALDICLAVSKSRDCCHLRYLNGAAPVVYGIPAFIKPVRRI
ncbi:separase/separin [Schizosaccharomyces japonicus yFS275]|uniref:separase n=1 Tax=Schizosaccharomyces japonicus (strain yFS275 / FY16936) TaxID=402676 RepID=B6K0I6_SCHJY|nr:separase/separin [Schizosaccharomyces japonicus yFS275]EEB07457.1 separase/separin [Schizosaccharomyces japonicus yFS275]